MKNIHVLPTEKPSRLGYLTKKGKEVFNDLRLFEKPMPNILDSENQHIYITSDEEIKEGDWFIDDKYKQPIKYFGEGSLLISSKKIILTTDQDLIKDGVFGIEDGFLEWFVKNPSCESVKIQYRYNFYVGQHLTHYKIIIPKEEPKTGSITECIKMIIDNQLNELEELKQETLEEAATNYTIDFATMSAFKLGAKWQQEQDKKMYSEEDMKEAFRVGFNVGYNDEESPSYLTFEEWIKEYKKK